MVQNRLKIITVTALLLNCVLCPEHDQSCFKIDIDSIETESTKCPSDGSMELSSPSSTVFTRTETIQAFFNLGPGGQQEPGGLNPNKGAHNEICQVIENARHMICIQSAVLMSGKILEALKKKIHESGDGFVVCLLVNGNTTEEGPSVLKELQDIPNGNANKCKVFCAITNIFEHNKIIFTDPNQDTSMLITGSANFTKSSSVCEENCVRISNKWVMGQFIDNWNNCLKFAKSQDAIKFFASDKSADEVVFNTLTLTKCEEISKATKPDGIEVFFSELSDGLTINPNPNAKMAEAIKKSIDSLQSGDELRMALFNLSDEDVVQSVLNAAELGVHVQIVLDQSVFKSMDARNRLTQLVTHPNIQLFRAVFKNTSALMHNKIIFGSRGDMIQWLFTGSFNPTAGNKSCENLVLFDNTDNRFTEFMQSHTENMDRLTMDTSSIEVENVEALESIFQEADRQFKTRKEKPKAGPENALTGKRGCGPKWTEEERESRILRQKLNQDSVRANRICARSGG